MPVRRVWTLREGSFAAGAIGTAGTNVVLAVLGVVTGVIAARLLGPEGRGQLAAIQTWPSFIATVAMLGLPDALVYFSAREPHHAGRYLGSSMALTLLLSALFGMAGYAAMPLLLAAQTPEIVTAARRYLLLAPIFALVAMPLHTLRGRRQFQVWNVLRLTPALGWLGVLAAGWTLGRAEPVFLAGYYLVVLALLFFPIMYTVRRCIPGPIRPDTAAWVPMLGYGTASALGSVSSLLGSRLDQMMIAALMPPQVLGLYVVVVAWGGAMNPVLSALGSALLPAVASQESPSRRSEVFARGCRLGVLLSAVLALIAVFATPLVLPVLFGDAFVTAVPAAVVMVIAGTLMGLNGIVEEGLRGLGQPSLILRAEFVGLAVSALGLILLLKPLGVMGAALASLGGSTSVVIALIVQAGRSTACSPRQLLIPRSEEILAEMVRLKSLGQAVR